MKNPKNAEECARMFGEARADILELCHQLRMCRNVLLDYDDFDLNLINGIDKLLDKHRPK